MKNVAAAGCLAAVLLGGCSKAPEPPAAPATPKGEAAKAAPKAGSLTGSVKLDGSSTVGPISEAVAEEFKAAQPGVQVTVGISGTGGGFKKFVVGETDISDASRPVKDDELSKAKENGIEVIELPVAFDGLSVVVNPANDWVDKLTIAELKKIWSPESKVKKWSEVRQGWPDTELKLYGPSTDNGTFEYFTEVVNGKAKACRSDYTPSATPNVLVAGIAGEKGALGYFGYAYYAANKDKLKLVPVDAGKGPQTPTEDGIRGGTYQPMSRPLFIYVSSKSADRPEVKALVDFYLENAATLSAQVGYVALPAAAYAAVREHWAQKKTGTLFKGAAGGVAIEDILKKEADSGGAEPKDSKAAAKGAEQK